MPYVTRFALVAAVVLGLAVATADMARADMITFNEVGAPAPGLIDGTTFYPGVEFENAFRFTGASQLPDDGAGITNFDTVMTITFTGGISSLEFTWATLQAGDAIAVTAYDGTAGVIDTFSNNTDLNGVETFFGDISYVEFSGGTGLIAVDTLTFDEATAPVPEPTSLALMGLGLAAAAGVRRRRRVS